MPSATVHRAPCTGEEHLLTGLATLLTGRYRTAAPLLRQAIDAPAAEPGLSERVPFWLLAITFAADAIWEDQVALAWVTRCEDLARRTGAMRPLTLCLIGASMARPAVGVPDQKYWTVDCLHHGAEGGGVGSEAAQRVRGRDHRMASALELADDSAEA